MEKSRRGKYPVPSKQHKEKRMYDETPQPETTTPRTLWTGIDTIKIGLGVQWTVEPHDMLNHLQEKVRNNPLEYQYDLNGKTWAVLPYGRKKYRYGLQHGQLSIFISEEDYTPESPNIMAEAYPQAIAGRTPNELQTEIHAAIQELNGTAVWEKTSELHLTTDTHVPQPMHISDIYTYNYTPKWITRARKTTATTDHNDDVERLISKGATLQSMRYGGTQLHVRIYNKTQELRAHTDKQWEKSLWRNPYAHQVTRVEFQIRREKLKCFGVNETRQLENQIPGIWKYLTEEWFTLNTAPSTKGNRDATPTEFWTTVQNAWRSAETTRPVPRPSQNAMQRISQAYGNLLSAAAILDLQQEEEITQMYNQWKQAHPQDWQNQVRQRQQKIEILCVG